MYIQSIMGLTLTKRKVVPDNFRYLNFSFALERHLLYNVAYAIIGTTGRSSYVRWDNQSVVTRTSVVGLLIIDSGFFQLPCRKCNLHRQEIKLTVVSLLPRHRRRPK